ncbi:class I SAM-dependent methyltransferase [Desulfospira joergensenii]|uniref:class I SAM-dependent methyltransferase n=1 Tax=Desulfospira joergensenii TaxID=53329 RepID=UPI0003B5A806|nr:class I SAM-dependent methyltransferase [Desulfospira joergensenii]
MEPLVKDHYASNDLILKIKTGLAKAGKDMDSLKVKDLAPVDQLHTCGAPATVSLLEKANVTENHRILDAGCGIGGSSRLMAGTFGCQVTGIDLSPSFIEAAEILTRHIGLDRLASFRTGSILDLPFENDSFDGVLCQHVILNIKDKAGAIQEFSRVLKPGGKLILHEVTRGQGPSPALPVPWAATPDTSFLEPWETCEALMKGAGFSTEYFRDDTRAGLAWWEKIKAAAEKNRGKTYPLGVHLIFGKNASLFRETMPRNFRNNSICLVEAVLKKL